MKASLHFHLNFAVFFPEERHDIVEVLFEDTELRQTLQVWIYAVQPVSRSSNSHLQILLLPHTLYNFIVMFT